MNSLVDKSCIFFLVKNDPIHLNRFEKCIDLLNENFLSKYPYPVVLGHENIDTHTLEYFKNKIKSVTYVYKPDFTLDRYSNEIRQQIPERFKGHWDENAFFSIGYRHMCHFFGGGIYSDPFFDNVKYLMRLDTDSYFNKPLQYDLFKQMEDQNLVYSTFRENTDFDYVCDGLFDCIKEFFTKEKMQCDLTDVKYNGTVETHLEISNLSEIRHSNYKKMFDYIDNTGNIYIKRWGDANLKYFGTKLFFRERSRFLENDNIGYTHGAPL